jgi:general secretion pathway protein J
MSRGINQLDGDEFVPLCWDELVTRHQTRYSLLVTRYSEPNSLLVALAKRPPSGFTLLEILVAMAILGVVVTTVLASFNMVFSTTERLDSGASVFEMGKGAMDRIVADLENVYILDRPFYKPPKTADPPDLYRIQGAVETSGGTNFAKLRLSSRRHVPLEPGARGIGIAEIVYYAQVRTRRRGGAETRRPPFPLSAVRGERDRPCFVRKRQIVGIHLCCRGRHGEEAWDSDSPRFGYATPTMIRVRLEVGTGDDATLFQTAVRLPLVRPKQG